MRSQQSLATFGAVPEPSRVLLYSADRDPYLNRMKRLLERRPSCEVHETTSAEEILEDVATQGAALLFISVRDPIELKSALQCLKRLQSLIQSHSLIVHGITDLNEERVRTLLKGRGCSEIFSTRTSWEILDNEVKEAAHILSMQQLITDFPKNREGAEVIEFPRKPKKVGKSFFDDDNPVCPIPHFEQKLKIWMGSDQAIESPLVEADLIEFGDDSLTLDVCAKTFSRGEHVFLIVDDGTKSPTSKVKLSVTLTAIAEGEDEHETVTVLLGDGLKKYIKPSQEAHAKFQAAVLEFLKSARGW